MIKEEILLVCGFGRCGSSLTMQMLQAGGAEVVGKYPAFEDDRTGLRGFDGAWLALQSGKALKFLEPLARRLRRARYRVLWLDRNPWQQAQSCAKMLRLIDHRRGTRRNIIDLGLAYQRDRPRVMKWAQKTGPVTIMEFESLILSPERAARELADWADLDGGQTWIDEMAAQVIPRGTKCRPDLEIEAQLAGGDLWRVTPALERATARDAGE